MDNNPILVAIAFISEAGIAQIEKQLADMGVKLPVQAVCDLVAFAEDFVEANVRNGADDDHILLNVNRRLTNGVDVQIELPLEEFVCYTIEQHRVQTSYEVH